MYTRLLILYHHRQLGKDEVVLDKHQNVNELESAMETHGRRNKQALLVLSSAQERTQIAALQMLYTTAHF